MPDIHEMIDVAMARLEAGTLVRQDLQAIRDLVRPPRVRQRLLYIQSPSPFIGAGIIATALHEPVVGGCDQLNPLAEELPYQCVHDAMVDGWQVIHFPDQRQLMLEPQTPEIGVMGYEFILQKLEVIPDEN